MVKASEAEGLGLFTNASQMLGWAPTLVFTIIIEAQLDITWGLISTAGFYAAGLVVMLTLKLDVPKLNAPKSVDAMLAVATPVDPRSVTRRGVELGPGPVGGACEVVQFTDIRGAAVC
jgi:hypothetical protein